MANYHKLLGKILASALREGMQARAGHQPHSKTKHSDAMKQRVAPAPSSRRRLAGGLAVILLTAAALAYVSGVLPEWIGSAASASFLISAMTRMGLVFAAIWLAWDSLQRPARWLPPGLALLGTLSIILVAAQPKLLIAVLPLLGIVAVLTTVLRAFRGKS